MQYQRNVWTRFRQVKISASQMAGNHMEGRIVEEASSG
jgi:hypothetical protein